MRRCKPRSASAFLKAFCSASEPVGSQQPFGLPGSRRLQQMKRCLSNGGTGYSSASSGRPLRPPQVSGSCHSSAQKYRATSAFGYAADSVFTAGVERRGVGRLRGFILDQAVFVRDAEGVEKRAHHRPLVLEVIRDHQPRRQQVGNLHEPGEVAGLAVDGSEYTLLGRNLIWRAIRATASACSRAACSSAQNALAADDPQVGWHQAPHPRRANLFRRRLDVMSDSVPGVRSGITVRRLGPAQRSRDQHTRSLIPNR